MLVDSIITNVNNNNNNNNNSDSGLNDKQYEINEGIISDMSKYSILVVGAIISTYVLTIGTVVIHKWKNDGDLVYIASFIR